VWTLILGAGICFYVLLAGFDLGVGSHYNFMPDVRSRNLVMNAIASVWDGNETWLVLGGVAMLAAFPLAFAILIVEFARQKEKEGVGSAEAAVHAARTRLRPILMTSFSFILGVAPLAVATGAGAEMRQSLGTAVLFGMLGVTCFGLLFTPTFYTFVRSLGRKEHGGGVVSEDHIRA